MPPKRKRRTSPPPKGLAAGERLNRDKLAGNDYSAWGWVGTEVTDASQITKEHCLRVYGFSGKALRPPCPNKYTHRESQEEAKPSGSKKPEQAVGELPEDVIVISDDEEEAIKCTKKVCKDSPNCLNHLGQEKWENEGTKRPTPICVPQPTKLSAVLQIVHGRHIEIFQSSAMTQLKTHAIHLYP
jgi:hypothetical protein